jgi:hypothetical protein
MIDRESNDAKRKQKDVSIDPNDVYVGLNGKCVQGGRAREDIRAAGQTPGRDS